MKKYISSSDAVVILAFLGVLFAFVLMGGCATVGGATCFIPETPEYATSSRCRF